MAFLKETLPEVANYGDVVRAYPEIMFHMLDVEQALLRGKSPFSEAQREMIVSYVSALNSCTYCYKSHLYVADELGIGEATTNVLAIVTKSNRKTPSRMTQVRYGRRPRCLL